MTKITIQSRMLLTIIMGTALFLRSQIITMRKPIGAKMGRHMLNTIHANVFHINTDVTKPIINSLESISATIEQCNSLFAFF